MFLRACLVLLVLLFTCHTPALAQTARRRVTVVKFRGPPAGLNKAAALCRIAVESWYQYVPESAFHNAAKELGITSALWRPDNLKRIAKQAGWDVAAVLFVKGEQLELGMFDGGNGRMVDRIKVPFTQFKFTKETAQALRNKIKTVVDSAMGISQTDPGRPVPDPPPVTRRISSPAQGAPRMLMLRGSVESTLPQHLQRSLYKGLGFDRFHLSIKSDNANIPAVQQWCAQAAQQLVGAGKSEGRAEALQQACGTVYQHDLATSHRCRRSGRGVVSCGLRVSLTIYAYLGEESGTKLSFSANKKFGTRGKVKVHAEASAEQTFSHPDQRSKAEQLALQKAVSKATKDLRGQLSRVAALQLRVPILRSRGGKVTFCLRGAKTSLDTPFAIVQQTSRGEKIRGYVKVTSVRRRCRDLPETETNAYTVVAQVTKGGRLRKGMLARELPYVGVGLGVFAGLTSGIGFFDGNVGVGGGLTFEYNFGPAVGVSGLQLFVGVLFGATTNGVYLRSKLLSTFPNTPLDPTVANFAFGWDLGLLKRWTLTGPLFLDLAAGLSGSAHVAPTPDPQTTVTIVGIGAMAALGLGVQLGPRWTIRLNVGYRILNAFVRVDAGVNCNAALRVCGSTSYLDHGLLVWPAVVYNW